MSGSNLEAMQLFWVLLESEIEFVFAQYMDSVTEITAFTSYEHTRTQWVQDNFNGYRDLVLSKHPELAKACPLFAQQNADHLQGQGRLLTAQHQNNMSPLGYIREDSFMSINPVTRARLIGNAAIVIVTICALAGAVTSIGPSGLTWAYIIGATARCRATSR